jgi:hypothetical protein
MLTPDEGEVAMLQKILIGNFTLKLFSNDKIPAGPDTAASYIEVAGGGYLSKVLTPENWTITTGNPSQALYNILQDFQFTGPTNAPGTLFGYYIVDLANIVHQAERFPDANVPFTPVNGSLIRVIPRFTLNNKVVEGA